MTIEYLIKRFEKDHQQNHALFQMFEDDTMVVPIECMKLASHIVNMHHIFLCRLSGKAAESAPWDVFTIHELIILNRANYRETKVYLDAMNETIDFHSYSDDLFNFRLDTMDHVILHSAYHRGQIVQMLKMNNLRVPTTLIPIIP